MLNSKDKEELRIVLDKAFKNLSTEERNVMFNALIAQSGAYTGYALYNGDNIARVGVKYESIGGFKGKVYYSTEYDDDSLDL